MHAEVADHPLFTGSIPVGIMSGEKPRFPSAGDHEALLRELQEMGVQHEDTTGRYGEPERSVLVYGLPRERMTALGKKYGQESVIHSEGGRHHLIYTNGPNAGSYHEDVPGRHEYFPSGSPEPADNNTKLPGGGYFRLAFDFDHLHPEKHAGGAEVPRSAVAAPVTKHELGHRLWAVVSELLQKTDPPQCPPGTACPSRPRPAGKLLQFPGTNPRVRDYTTRIWPEYQDAGYTLTVRHDPATSRLHAQLAHKGRPASELSAPYAVGKIGASSGGPSADDPLHENMELALRHRAAELQHELNPRPLYESLGGLVDLNRGSEDPVRKAGESGYRGGHRRVQAEAAEYARSAGLQPESQVAHTVDNDLLQRAATTYEGLRHDPEDPEVRRSYDALKRETLAQYDHLVRAGYKFEPHAAAALVPTAYSESGPMHPDTPFVKEQGAPYLDDRELAADIGNNKHLHVFSEGAPPADHPLAEKIPGHPLGNYNNVFRAVHDVFGHAKTGADFGHHGEDHAWRSHAAMYSPTARRALTTETRGQNSAYHFGRHGATNRANPAQSIFPDQKAALMPEEFSHLPGESVRKSADLNLMSQERSAVADDKMSRDPRTALHGLYKTLREEVEAYEAECVALRKAETARLEKKAPPGFSEDTMHELKSKHGTESAFKIAWASYDKKHGRKPKTEKAEKDAGTKPHKARCAECGQTVPFNNGQPLPHDDNSGKECSASIKKASATDGGMGDGGAAGFAMSEDDARAESYAKGEMDLCKACGMKRGPKHDCDEVEAYAKGELEKGAASTLGPRGGGSPGGVGPSSPPVSSPLPPSSTPDAPSGGGGGKQMLPGELAHSELDKDELDGDGARAPKTDHGSLLPAGTSPTTPGPKPGVTPSTKESKIALPQTKEGGNGLTKEPVKKSALPGAAPTAPAAAGPKLPKMPGAPKLPGVGKPAAPKTPPMGAGTPAPNVKAEPDAMAKVSLGPDAMAARKKFGERTQQEQAAKLPAVRASVGGLMDNMLASGPLNPGQPLNIKPIASSAVKLPGAHLSPGQGLMTKKPGAPAAAQSQVEAKASAVPMVSRVAGSLAPPPAAARALPGAHLFAPKQAFKAEPKPGEKCPKCGEDHKGADHATAVLFGNDPKPLHPSDKKGKK